LRRKVVKLEHLHLLREDIGSGYYLLGDDK